MKDGTSPWLRAVLKRLVAVQSGTAWDIPCGRGRHSRLLLDDGYRLLSGDIDLVALGNVSANTIGAHALAFQVDALGRIPLAPASIDLVVIIHPHSTGVLEALHSYVRPGGHLVIETFGAQGENWRALPRSREIPDAILCDFKAVAYRETKVGRAVDAVTAKGLFQRRN